MDPSRGSDDSISACTEDAIDVVARFDIILASLKKAGVPPEELQHFKRVVGRLPRTAVAPDVRDVDAGQPQEDVVVEGALEKLQRGTQGFSPVWKSRWVRVSPGELKVFESAHRPKHPDTPCLFRLPLSVQQTRIDPGKEALCKRLGREAILMVSSTTAVGGTLRCVTLATKDNLALEKWMSFLEEAMSQEGHVAGASIFRASQTGDIFRVKELVTRGVGVNCANPYGCVPLHYAVKNAADFAVMLARGGDGVEAEQAKAQAQQALRVVVFLMSHGADARAANHLGETPFELASRLTSGFPKSQTLLLSILDSSKYQITGGTIFIVPGAESKKTSDGKKFLTSIREEGAADKGNDEMAGTPLKTTTARGVTFSPSRRSLRAKKRYEIAKSKLPYVLSAAAPSFAEGRCRSGNAAAVTPALPRGDHEAALGGPRHRLAAGHGARCSRNDQRCDVGGGVRPRHRPGAPTIGVHFKDYRMGRSSGVLIVDRPKRRKGGYSAERPASCPTRMDDVARSGCSGTRQTSISPVRCASSSRVAGGDGVDGGVGGGRRRPATTMADGREAAGLPGGKPHLRRQERRMHGGGRLEERPKKRQHASKPSAGEGGGRGPSVPDREARRQISEWLRESAGTASAVPPATAHGVGDYLVETSPFVAMDHRSDVYRALQAINGDGKGGLISSDRLRAVLCNVGQPLLQGEMDDLLQETDPTGTGYVSCSRLSKLMIRERLAPLAKGTMYNEEDDVVMHAKARRVAREKRLERAAAIAQQSAAAAAQAKS